MPGTSMRMPTSRSVASERAAFVVDFELDVLQDRLGAAGGSDGGGRLKGGQEFFAIAGDFHGREFCRKGF